MKNCIHNICRKTLVCVLAAAISSSSLCGIPMTVYAGNTGTGNGTEAGAEFGTVAGMKAEAKTGDRTVDDADESICTDGQGIVYTLLSENKCYVSGYSENIKSSIKIPTEIKKDGENYDVKGIREGAFEGCKALKTVEISNSITDIEGDAFSKCSNLKKISVALDRMAEKTDGKTAIVTVKIDAGLLSTPAEVELEVGTALIGQAAADKKTNQVYVKVFAAANDDYPQEDVAPDSILLQKEAAKKLAAGKKGFRLQVRDALGSSYYVRVKESDLKKVTENLLLAVRRQEVKSFSGDEKTDLRKVFRKNSVDAEDAEIFSYSFGKGNRTTVDLAVPAKDVKGAKPGSKVYVYRYDSDKRVFAEISFHPFTVSKHGNVRLTITKGGTFVVTGKAFGAMSRKPSSEFITEGGAVYYIDKGGEPVRGWKKLGGEYYYFDRETGKMAAGKKVDGVKLNEDGTARQTEAGVARIRTMIKARAVVEKVTKPTDSIEQKREKCFRWVFQFPYRRYRRLQPIYKKPGWEVTFANDIFDHRQGCCVSDASAVAFLFHECGYEEVYVACDTSHAWVELEGRVYDPLFAEARGFSKYYNIPYSSYYASKPVLKRKI